MRKSKRSDTDKIINHCGRLVVVDSLFPEALLNVRTITKNKESSRLNTKHLESLSQFITTRDYKFFIEALRHNRELLRCYYHNKGRSLDVDSFLEKNDYKNETVDDYSVVRTTINWLRELYQYVADADNAENARKILERISPLLVIPRMERVIQDIDEYFIHVFPKVRGEHPSLEYKNPYKFIDRWDQVRTAFEVTKSKKYYRLGDSEIKNEDAVKAIQRLGYELNEDDVRHLNLKNIQTKTASYIKLVHEFGCPICNKKTLSDKTILRLYQKAQKHTQE